MTSRRRKRSSPQKPASLADYNPAMQLEMNKLSSKDRYKLLTSVIVPRPIALVTTLDGAGGVNAAPFSFFNAMGSDPALIVLGIGNRSREDAKDTARYIRASGEFVVNVVTEEIAERMNITACDFPAGVDELAMAGLTGAPSRVVKPPRVVESPINMECREVSTTEIGRNRVILGEILVMHIRDELIDPERMYLHTEKLHTVGRMHAPSAYTRTRDQFDLPRISYEQWQATRGQPAK
jgi:flavin reductase (DIM6/NTAB) family NADH-FMN oxidoreductase RutF